MRQLIFITLLSFCAAAQSPLWKQGIPLIPHPQEVVLSGEPFTFAGTVGIAVEGGSAADQFAAADLAARLKSDYGIDARVGAAKPARTILLSRKGAPAKVGQQGYELAISKDRVTVRAKGEDGLFYGTRTLLQIIRQSGAGASVDGMKITDWPDIRYRAIHYDTKHHQDKADYVRAFLRELADYKVNMLVWEWEDKFAYQSHPEIGAPGAFTKEEMQAFTRYARQYHIQIVPLVQGLGHVSFILKWPQHAHLREIAASNWEFCPRKDGSYKLLFDLWDEAMEATPGSEFLHMGTDETYELGQGIECGCKARAQEVGRYGLMQDFVKRCVDHIASKGRKTLSWVEYKPNERVKPPAGLQVPEFGDRLEDAKLAREAGYPVWAYDPNPGIEHLFLPYFYRASRDKEIKPALQASYESLSKSARSGLFDGMICTSWDDSGLHNQAWMMRFVQAAELSWNGKATAYDEFKEKYFANYYGPKATRLPELWMLLSKGAYYYMDTFERKVWHWGEIGKTHLPDLPRLDAIEYNPYWNTRYKSMVERSRAELENIERAREICRANLAAGVKHAYDFEVFETLTDLIAHTARTYLVLSDLEKAVSEAHNKHFTDHQASYAAFERAARILENNISERERVFANLVSVWEKTRLPKGMSLPGKPFFHQQDRARHFAFRQPDMSYVIYDERRLGIDDYLANLRKYMDWYKKTYL